MGEATSNAMTLGVSKYMWIRQCDSVIFGCGSTRHTSYISDYGGIRIEDNVVVTDDGVDSLTTFARELRAIGV